MRSTIARQSPDEKNTSMCGGSVAIRGRQGRTTLDAAEQPNPMPASAPAPNLLDRPVYRPPPQIVSFAPIASCVNSDASSMM